MDRLINCINKNYAINQNNSKDKTLQNFSNAKITLDSPSRLAMTARIFGTAPSVNVDGPPDHVAVGAEPGPFAAPLAGAPDGADAVKNNILINDF